MYTLKSVARRSTFFGAAVAVFAATLVPTAPVFADALNPLTERSLLLSSSAPGFQNTDGSGNSEGSLNANGETFAVPGSGPNGSKTGETFTFNVSSDSTGRPIEGITFQYCTSAAGVCQAPGDNTGDADPNNDGSTADSTRESNATAHPLGRSDLDVVGTFAEGIAEGEFQVLVEGVAQEGWTMDAINLEDVAHSDPLTGKNNYIRLMRTEGTTGATPTPGQTVQIVFRASTDTYITNPGSGSFFVKINTFDTSTAADLLASNDSAIIDGGVTVANVMTDSIHITTKVLETMSFSVGTENRDKLDIGSGQTHGKCDALLQPNGNRLNLGNQNAEFSLETDRAWDVNSYWRLSSNSSGGATVYYSGNTLANTVGDEIAEMPSEVVSTPGTEQFGLGFIDAGLDGLDGDGPGGAAEAGGWAVGYKTPSSYPFRTLNGQESDNSDPDRDFTDLTAQTASSAYDEATGTLFDDSGATVLPGTAKFKFLKSSNTVPEPIAQQDEQVISCATAKMRYVANIGADTPAGVYTTKINYLAAPQY